MATLTRIRGDTCALALTLVNPDTGAAFNPTGQTLLFSIKKVANAPDSAALVQKSGAVGGITVVSAPAGSIVVELVPADWALLTPGTEYAYDVQAQDTVSGAVRTVDLGTFTGRNDVTKAVALAISTTVVFPLPGALDPSSFVGNFYTITTLAGLAALSAGALAALQNGAVIRLFFSGSIVADYRLRANGGAETQSAPWRILATNATLRLWELIGVQKQGVPCAWNPDTVKFHQILASGTGTAATISLAAEADAFTLP